MSQYEILLGFGVLAAIVGTYIVYSDYKEYRKKKRKN